MFSVSGGNTVQTEESLKESSDESNTEHHEEESLESSSSLTSQTDEDDENTACGKRSRNTSRDRGLKRQRIGDELQNEVTCPLCQDLLVLPVCTICGHTFCKPCILRCLDRSNKCPLCRSVLHLNRLTPVNIVMEKMLMSIYGDRYTDRIEEIKQENTINDKVPLLVLQVAVFPGQKLPLNIFDARYKLMLRRVLESGGKFGIVSLLDKQMSNIGTLVSIEHHACLADGRHLLTVKGISRFQLVESELVDGYNVAIVKHLEDEDKDEMNWKSEETPAGSLNSSLINLTPSDLEGQAFTSFDLYLCTLDQLKKKMSLALPLLEKSNGEIPSQPCTFSFWLASVLPLPATAKQSLLECTTTKSRLLEEFKILHSMYATAAPA